MINKEESVNSLALFCNKALMSECRSSVSNRELFLEISQAVDLPNTLLAIDDMRAFLERVNPKLIELGEYGDPVAEWMIEWFLKVFDDNENILDDLEVKRNQNKANGYSTLRPYTSSNPLFAAITSGCEGKYFNEYDWMLVHTLLVYQDLHKCSSKQFVINFCRAARSLGEAKSESIREMMPTQVMSTKGYHENLLVCLQEAKNHWNGYHELEVYVDALNVLYARRKFNSKKSNGIGRSTGDRSPRGVRLDQINVGARQEHSCRSEIGYSRRIVEEQEKSHQAWIYEDGTNDLRSRVEYLEVIPTRQAFRLATPEVAMLGSAGAAHAIANRNQCLPTHWGRLSPYEMSAVINQANTIIFDKKSCSIDREAATAILISLLFGQPIERVVTLCMYRQMVEDIKGDLAYCKKEAVMLVRTTPVFYKKALSKAAKKIVRPTVSILPLGCTRIIINALNLMDRPREDGKSSGYRIFNYSAEHLKINCRRFLKKAIVCSGRSISLEMISRYIPLSAADISNDLTDAVLMTGVGLDQLASQAHYTARPVRSLQRLYARTISVLTTITYNEFPISNIHRSLSVNVPKVYGQNDWIGAKAIPTSACVQELVHNLQKRLKILRLSAGQRRIEFHNLLTCYLILMLDHATASRSVRFKYHFEDDFDLIKGTALISDKDFSDYYNSRIVPLPKVCIEQIIIYKDWISKFCLEMPMLDMDTYRLITDANNQVLHGLTRRSIQDHKKKTFGSLFFIGKNMKPKAVSPDEMRTVLKGALDYAWPLNLWANRGYIRTEMRLKNVQGEQLDTLLGHWNYGQSAQERFSTYAWDDALDDLSIKIGNLMSRDGWRVENGL